MQALTPEWLWFFILVSIALGAVFGSFLSCALYRVPRGLSLRQPPSQCPRCGTKLKPLDLIPVLSWVFSRGKCRHCGGPIPASYPATEALSAALALLALFISFQLSAFAFSFLLLYGFFMAALFAGVVYRKHSKTAPKSVAFGLLCLGLYVAFLLG